MQAIGNSYPRSEPERGASGGHECRKHRVLLQPASVVSGSARQEKMPMRANSMPRRHRTERRRDRRPSSGGKRLRFTQDLMDGSREPSVSLPDAGDTGTAMRTRIRDFYRRGR